jgi:glycosyltransferase involved in cell wall biosynthesis
LAERRLVLVTVAICTRNRSRALERTLRSLSTIVVPTSLQWEVVVVDNGSRDDTAKSIASFSAVLPLRALVESRVGLSHARNAAIAAARGEYILWLDDDVLVETGWLSAYHDAFRAWPDVAFFGGPIIPELEGTPPRWLQLALPHVSNAYASLDLGDTPVALTRETLPFGANFVVRAEEQRRCAFDPALGRRGELLYAGEEWAVLQELLARGAAGRWVPGARVRHVIPVHRQSVRYLRRYYTGNAMSLARTRTVIGEPMLFGRPRWAWREAVLQELAYRTTRVYASADVWSVHLRRASIAWGLLRSPASAKHDQSSFSSGSGR